MTCADFTAQRADMESAPASGLWFSCNMSGWIFGYRQILINAAPTGGYGIRPYKSQTTPANAGMVWLK
jgi:hypothetical protein